MIKFIDFGNIKDSEEAIKKTWIEFRSALAKKEFNYDDIEKAKRYTFLKVYDDMFNINKGIQYNTISISEINSFSLGRGAIIRENKKPTYDRFIPNKKYISVDNRFSPPGVEWLYLTIGNEEEIHLCAQAECRAKKGDRFAFCHFENVTQNDSLKLVDLTISDKYTHETINNNLEEYCQAKYRKALNRFLTDRFINKESLVDEELRNEITKWGVYTYSKLLSDHIFEPVEETDKDVKKLVYAPFQTMAQYYISLGYSGILYGSTVSRVGRNLVLFDKDIARPQGIIEDYIISD